MTSLDPTVEGRTVLLAGASGLVGARILGLLQDDPTVARIVVLVRRATPTTDRRTEMHVVDFDRLDDYASLFDVDQIFCALGTTMKQAGSQAAFERVDLEYPRSMARIGVAAGVHHFLLVSALGASTESRVFYNRVKGELENSLRRLSFRSVTIVRPSLLLGKRKEFRFFERLGMVIGEFIPGPYRPVKAADVAKALVASARRDRPGFCIIESGEIVAAGRE